MIQWVIDWFVIKTFNVNEYDIYSIVRLVFVDGTNEIDETKGLKKKTLANVYYVKFII